MYLLCYIVLYICVFYLFDTLTEFFGLLLKKRIRKLSFWLEVSKQFKEEYTRVVNDDSLCCKWWQFAS